MGTLTPAFAVPIYTERMPDSGEVNAQLRQLFVSRENRDYMRHDPYPVASDGLFESRFDLFDWPEPAVGRMRDFCLAQLYQLIGEINGYDTATLQRLHMAQESWFHITRAGGYFGYHNHPMHSWSGVYCVCQEGDDDVEGSGLLTFMNPHPASTMYMDMASLRMKAPYSPGSVALRLQPGQLVLFPSWMLHEVTAFKPRGDGLRITVAFNARFQLVGQASPAGD
jgi:hypothetical protein